MATRTIDRLVFVYDARSGTLGAVVDLARKMMMMKGCPLRAITRGVWGERSEWKDCRSALAVPVEYFHTDDLTPELRALTSEGRPTVLAHVPGTGHVFLLGPGPLDACKGSVAALETMLREAARVSELTFR
jgi:hypothetical protein